MPKHHYKKASSERKCSLLHIPHFGISGLPQVSPALQPNAECLVPSEQECRPGYNGGENFARHFSLLAVYDFYASTQKILGNSALLKTPA